MALLFAAIAIRPSAAAAKPEFFEAFKANYPFVVGTRLESCNVCHTNPPRRNPYGTDFNLSGRDFAAIEHTDSDGDGADNISEITGLTFPGDANDGPNSTPMPTATSTRTATATRTNTKAPTNTPKPTNTRGPTPTIVPGPCYGDCNGNGAVAVNELILGVNISLELKTADACPLADADGNGQVSVSELIKAVNRSLYGCPPQL